MLLVVAVGTDQCQIIQVVIVSIPVHMMHLQHLKPIITAPLAFFTLNFQQSNFNGSLRYYFIFALADIVLYTSPALVRASPAAGYFIEACQHRLPANNAGKLFPARNTIARGATIYTSLTPLDFYRPPVDGFLANPTDCI